MNPLLKIKPPLGVPKVALDALLTELTRPENGTVYDRDYQTGHKNPFADSRSVDDYVPVKSVESSVELQTGQVDGHERVLPPRDKKILSETTQNELKAEKGSDEEPTHHVSLASSKYDFEKDANKRIATKLASTRSLSTCHVAVDNHSLMVHVPMTGQECYVSIDKVGHIQKEVSTALNVTTKFASMAVNPGFDGIILEFILV